MAIYVCTDCDEKLCEQCWDVDHKNKKRSHHQKLLLYFECDLCTRGHNKKDKALPALWFCTPCKLMLCKQCWHDEHKNPKRRKHNKQFLYPDGEEGPWADVTTRAQGVEVCTDKFKGKDIVCWMRKNTDRACSVCPPSQGKAALYSCEECDPRNPEKLCEDCWFTEHKNKKRRDHRKKLLLYMCDVCHDIEGRPAFHLCADCKLKLCDACWKLEHKNPTRKNHRKGELYPSLMKGPSKGKSKGLLDQINRFLDKMKVKKRAEEPQFPAVEGTDGLFPETYQPASVHGAIGGALSYHAQPAASAYQQPAIPQYEEPHFEATASVNRGSETVFHVPTPQQEVAALGMSTGQVPSQHVPSRGASALYAPHVGDHHSEASEHVEAYQSAAYHAPQNVSPAAVDRRGSLHHAPTPVRSSTPGADPYHAPSESAGPGRDASLYAAAPQVQQQSTFGHPAAAAAAQPWAGSHVQEDESPTAAAAAAAPHAGDQTSVEAQVRFEFSVDTHTQCTLHVIPCPHTHSSRS